MDVEKDEQEIIERVAALDIGKAELVCCVRVPGPGRRRMQEVRMFSTMTRTLLLMADWLAGLGVSRVVMEATSDYWKPPFYLLEGSFETWLVNAGTSSTCPGGRRRTGWTRCGCARSPSVRCCGRVSYHPHPSGYCGT